MSSYDDRYENMSDFDKDFVTDADIEDGFVESDGARLEREEREQAIKEFKEARRAQETAAENNGVVAELSSDTQYSAYRRQLKADAEKYASMTVEDEKNMSDEEKCRLYDAYMQNKDLEEDDESEPDDV